MAYLRPETAQGMFVNFANVLNSTRKKPPFGIAQVGKSFRNEITPQNWIFRTREFEQMEMEYFVPPPESAKWYEYWCEERHRLVRRARRPGGDAAPARPRRRRAVALLVGHVRRRVPLPVGLGRARGHRPAHRLRPQPARRALGRAARLLRPDDRRALPPVRDRAGGRRHPAVRDLPARRLRRGRRQRRDAHRAAPASAARAVQGGRAAAVEEGHADAARAARCGERSASGTWSTTTRRRRSVVATAVRTRSARRCASRSTSTRSRTAPSRSAIATRPSRCGFRSPTSSTRCRERLGF